MDRETALQQLQDMRQEILAIYAETDKCRMIQKRVEALQNEKEHPTPPSVSLKPENTAEKLKTSLEEQNRRHHENSTKSTLIVKLVNVALQIIICALLAMDLFGHKGIIIKDAMMTELMQFGDSNCIMLFVFQIILSAIVIVAPLCWNFFKKHWILCGATSGLIGILYFFMMGVQVKAWAYVLLFIISVGLLLAALFATRTIRSQRIKSPTLTAAQKRQVESARQADERAKAENAEAIAAANKKSEADHKQRLPEIDREIQENIQAFGESRKCIDEHMAKLDAMDCLCDDDKTLQIVDLLIRFINTRRADSIKEALQEYDKLMANQQLLEIEKQKLQAELQRAASEHTDRMQQLESQRRHQSEMEYLARDNANSRAQIISQLNSIGGILYYDLHF